MQSQNEYSYLDEDPQEIRPYEFEVPILHMAIIDVSTIILITPFEYNQHFDKLLSKKDLSSTDTSLLGMP